MEGGSRKVRVGEPASEGGEVTLSLKEGAFPEGGIRAHRHYAVADPPEYSLTPTSDENVPQHVNKFCHSKRQRSKDEIEAEKCFYALGIGCLPLIITSGSLLYARHKVVSAPPREGKRNYQ